MNNAFIIIAAVFGLATPVSAQTDWGSVSHVTLALRVTSIQDSLKQKDQTGALLPPDPVYGPPTTTTNYFTQVFLNGLGQNLRTVDTVEAGSRFDHLAVDNRFFLLDLVGDGLIPAKGANRIAGYSLLRLHGTGGDAEAVLVRHTDGTIVDVSSEFAVVHGTAVLGQEIGAYTEAWTGKQVTTAILLPTASQTYTNNISGNWMNAGSLMINLYTLPYLGAGKLLGGYSTVVKDGADLVVPKAIKLDHLVGGTGGVVLLDGSVSFGAGKIVDTSLYAPNSP